MTEFYIGTSGWHYEDWIGIFYPQNLPKTKWLGFYSQHFNTVELNNSFYHLPTEKAFKNWQVSVPAEFRYSVKVSRFITHIKRLKNAEEALGKFLSRSRLLEDKLEVLLYQLPPQMKINLETLEAFLTQTPQPLHQVFEFRNKTWMVDSTFELLKKYHAGFCIFDMPDFTSPIVSTTKFTYIRFHGSHGLYSSSYSEEELKSWTRKIKHLAKGLESVYIYFNNDAEAFAVQNAFTLRQLLSPVA